VVAFAKREDWLRKFVAKRVLRLKMVRHHCLLEKDPCLRMFIF